MSGKSFYKLFLKTEVFEKPCCLISAAHRIKALIFSQIVLETIFSLYYYDNEFR